MSPGRRPWEWLLLLVMASPLAGGPDSAALDAALDLATAPDRARREAGVAALRRLASVQGEDGRTVAAAGILGSGAVRPRLLRLLKDPDPALRRAAAEGLSRCGGSGGEADLLALLGDADDRAALGAARALGALGARAPKPKLQALRDGGGSPREAVAAAAALEILEPGYHLEYLRKGLRNPAVRRLAAAAACDSPLLVPAAETDPAKFLGVDVKALFLSDPDLPEDGGEAMALLSLRLGLLHVPELAEIVDGSSPGPGEAAARLLASPIPGSASATARGLVDAAERNSFSEPALDRIAAVLRARCGVEVPAGKPRQRADWVRAWWDRTWRDQVDGEVDAVIARGVAWLESRQAPAGFFRFRAEDRGDSANSRGITALAGYTLLRMDVPAGAPSVEKAAEFLLKEPGVKSFPGTYGVAVESMFLSELAARHPAKALRARAMARVHACADWLVRARVVFEPGGYGQCAWGYGASSGRGVDRYDHSVTQYALLGLLAARAVGAKVPMEVWRDAARHWETVQCADGGWDYIPKVLERPSGGETGTTSMTGAGIMGRLVGLAAGGAGETAVLADTDRAVKRALELWASKRPVPAFAHLGRGSDGHGVYYDLYSLERALMLAGKRMLGDWDWYREGALLLYRNQALDGSFGAGEADTCFALLFLKKAYVPVATK